MTYYIGNENSPSSLLGPEDPRYFYALRIGADNATLYFAKIDQVLENYSLTVNVPGPSGQNFENFEYGVDFFEGRSSADHSRPYSNLYYDQYRWDGKNCYYYIDSTGELVVRINQSYSYS
jgi:hypothetical protein